MDQQLVLALIPVVVPMVIAGLKALAPRVPKRLLPILAPILGGMIDAGAAYLQGGAPNPVLAAALGSAGVGLREILDQMTRGGRRPRGVVCLLAAVGCLSLVSCAGPEIRLPMGTVAVMYAKARSDYTLARLLVARACKVQRLDPDDCEAAAAMDVRARVYAEHIESALSHPETPIDWEQVLAYSGGVVDLLIKLGLNP